MHARENIYIDGKWVAASGEGSIEIINPATEQCIGSVSYTHLTLPTKA